MMATGHHAARTAGVGAGKTAAVVGDGAVGRCGDPGRVFDRAGPLDEVPDGSRTMNDPEAIKVMVEL